MGHPKIESLDEQAEANAEVEGPVRRLPIYHPKNWEEECEGGPRPCPLVGCEGNLYLNVDRDGQISFVFPDREPWDMPPDESCVYDVLEAHPDGLTLEATGKLFNVTRERIRQLEEALKRKIRNRKYLLRQIGDLDEVRSRKTARLPDDLPGRRKKDEDLP